MSREIKKAKLWKIGTNINSYINEFFINVKKYNLKINDKFILRKIKNTDRVEFMFNNNEDSVNYQNAKASQMIRVLLMLNIVKSFSDKFKNESDLIDNSTYTLEFLNENWMKNFLSNLENFQFIDELNEDGEELNEFIYPNHKDALYSIMKSFKAYNDGIEKYSKQDKKDNGFWFIDNLFKNYKNELEIHSCRIAFQMDKPIKLISDIKKIEGKDLPVKILKDIKDIKDENLKSELWNLVDILSSTKNILIPIMQRKYVWNEDLVDKLIDDIISIEKEKKFHYIGSIVFKENEENYKILDGQQRLTTMFLILASINRNYLDEELQKFKLKIPEYFFDLFPKYKSKKPKYLYEKFRHIPGNPDFQEFYSILNECEDIKKNQIGNMTRIFNFVSNKIRKLISEKNEIFEKQKFLDKLFENTIMRITFTANKNQIESEYSIFEKLNTLSKPLSQIDLLKNYLLPFHDQNDIDKYEQDIQSKFDSKIYKKFGKGLNIEASVKRFINYFIMLNEFEFLKSKEKNNKPFLKLQLIIEKKYNLKKGTLNHGQFIQILEKIGQEIFDFLSITNKNYYTDSNNKYYDYSDILISFEKRYVYSPLIKLILEKENVEKFKSSSKILREKINKIRKILFEIERYELYFQIVLYRGQSITGIILKIIEKINDIYKNEQELTSSKIRKIFLNDDPMSKNLKIPDNEKFIENLKNKVKNDPMADKVSILILNRIKFFFNNGEKIELNSTFNYKYLQKPTREHIMSQTIKDSNLRKKIFNRYNSENEYDDNKFNILHNSHLDMIGNILMVEHSDNSEFNNQSSILKEKLYKLKNYLNEDPSYIGIEKENLLSLKNIIESNELSFNDIKDRSESIAKYLAKIYK